MVNLLRSIRLSLSIVAAVPSGIPLQVPIPQTINPSINGFSTVPGTGVTDTSLTAGSNSASQPEPFANTETSDDHFMPDPIPREPSQPESQRFEPPPDPVAIEADNRAAMWSEHSDTMKQIKDDVDSMLATLWARDTDPGDLRDMFATMKEEVKQTRMRLLP